MNGNKPILRKSNIEDYEDRVTVLEGGTPESHSGTITKKEIENLEDRVTTLEGGIVRPHHNTMRIRELTNLEGRITDLEDTPATTLSIDFNITDSIDLFGKVVSDLQSSVAESDNEITGTLKYITNYTGFSSKVEEQSGNYLVLHVDTNSKDDVYVEVVNGYSGPVKLDSDKIIVLRIADKDTQSIKVTTGNLVEDYDISGLTIEISE